LKPSSPRLVDLGEDEVVRELTSSLPTDGSVVAGAGDDCAVLEYGRMGHYQLFKTDCLVQDVHYFPDTPPKLVGRKALARALSDIAAMGGWPTQAVVTLVLSPNYHMSYAKEIYEGLSGVAREFGVSVVGGETARPAASSGRTAIISVSLLGLVEKGRCVLRSGGSEGDQIFVTGTLGGSIKGKHLQFQPRVWEGRWLSEHFKPSAMMDLSDGLAKDLPRLAKQSGVGFQLVYQRVPKSPGCEMKQALNDGEDYELLFTVPPDRAEALKASWSQIFPGLPLTNIGWLCSEEESMASEFDNLGGWDHFQMPIST
jgi:thiamine-monophosphate kinase